MSFTLGKTTLDTFKLYFNYNISLQTLKCNIIHVKKCKCYILMKIKYKNSVILGKTQVMNHKGKKIGKNNQNISYHVTNYIAFRC